MKIIISIFIVFVLATPMLRSERDHIIVKHYELIDNNNIKRKLTIKFNYYDQWLTVSDNKSQILKYDNVVHVYLDETYILEEKFLAIVTSSSSGFGGVEKYTRIFTFNSNNQLVNSLYLQTYYKNIYSTKWEGDSEPPYLEINECWCTTLQLNKDYSLTAEEEKKIIRNDSSSASQKNTYKLLYDKKEGVFYSMKVENNKYLVHTVYQDYLYSDRKWTRLPEGYEHEK